MYKDDYLFGLGWDQYYKLQSDRSFKGYDMKVQGVQFTDYVNASTSKPGVNNR